MTMFVAILGILLPIIHLFVSKIPKTKEHILKILLLYSFIFHVGVMGFFLGFIPHVFFADPIAKSIGWQPGSPFQFEVGLHDGAWGILGFLCLWIRGTFWIATGVGWSFFMLGAAYGHIRETILHNNYATYNFFMIFVDAFIAIYLLLLLYLYFKMRKDLLKV